MHGHGIRRLEWRHWWYGHRAHLSSLLDHAERWPFTLHFILPDSYCILFLLCRLEPGFPRRSSVSPMRGGSETMLPDLGSPGPGHVGGANPQALRQLLNGGGGSGGGGGGGYRRQSFGGSPYMPSGAGSHWCHVAAA